MKYKSKIQIMISKYGFHQRFPDEILASKCVQNVDVKSVLKNEFLLLSQ